MRRYLSVFVFAAAVIALCLPGTAYAGWHTCAKLNAGGDAKEVSVNREIDTCLIECKEGSVIINTVVVREGGKKTPIKVTRTLNKGESHRIDLGAKKMVTGFRISDGGSGRYHVCVK